MEATKLDKKCPFLQDICIESDCALWVIMQRQRLGKVESTGMCSFPSVVVLTTEVIGLLQRQQSPVRLPPGLIGRG